MFIPDHSLHSLSNTLVLLIAISVLLFFLLDLKKIETRDIYNEPHPNRASQNGLTNLLGLLCSGVYQLLKNHAASLAKWLRFRLHALRRSVHVGSNPPDTQKNQNKKPVGNRTGDLLQGCERTSNSANTQREF